MGCHQYCEPGMSRTSPLVGGPGCQQVGKGKGNRWRYETHLGLKYHWEEVKGKRGNERV